VVGSSSNDGIYLLDFHPDTSSACHIDYRLAYLFFTISVALHMLMLPDQCSTICWEHLEKSSLLIIHLYNFCLPSFMCATLSFFSLDSLVSVRKGYVLKKINLQKTSSFPYLKE
jgi:hypothetical protein